MIQINKWSSRDVVGMLPVAAALCCPRAEDETPPSLTQLVSTTYHDLTRQESTDTEYGVPSHYTEQSNLCVEFQAD
jgi:hypothetical protein